MHKPLGHPKGENDAPETLPVLSPGTEPENSLVQPVEVPVSPPDHSPEELSVREQLMRQWPSWDWEKRSE